MTTCFPSGLYAAELNDAGVAGQLHTSPYLVAAFHKMRAVLSSLAVTICFPIRTGVRCRGDCAGVAGQLAQLLFTCRRIPDASGRILTGGDDPLPVRAAYAAGSERRRRGWSACE